MALAERLSSPSPALLQTPEELGEYTRTHTLAFLLGSLEKEIGEGEVGVLIHVYICIYSA